MNIPKFEFYCLIYYNYEYLVVGYIYFVSYYYLVLLQTFGFGEVKNGMSLNHIFIDNFIRVEFLIESRVFEYNSKVSLN